MESAPKIPASFSNEETPANKLDRLRAVREAYLRRVTGADQNVGGEHEAQEADSADETLKRMNEEIAALEAELPA